jgi:hypothetical protein
MRSIMMLKVNQRFAKANQEKNREIALNYDSVKRLKRKIECILTKAWIWNMKSLNGLCPDW